MKGSRPPPPGAVPGGAASPVPPRLEGTWVATPRLGANPPTPGPCDGGRYPTGEGEKKKPIPPRGGPTGDPADGCLPPNGFTGGSRHPTGDPPHHPTRDPPISSPYPSSSPSRWDRRSSRSERSWDSSLAGGWGGGGGVGWGGIGFFSSSHSWPLLASGPPPASPRP